MMKKERVDVKLADQLRARCRGPSSPFSASGRTTSAAFSSMLAVVLRISGDCHAMMPMIATRMSFMRSVVVGWFPAP
tara:strand:- start:694 stop:924 length:231 start_codon:yes stop_codon:yes gene_type:complete